MQPTSRYNIRPSLSATILLLALAGGMWAVHSPLKVPTETDAHLSFRHVPSLEDLDKETLLKLVTRPSTDPGDIE